MKENKLYQPFGQRILSKMVMPTLGETVIFKIKWGSVISIIVLNGTSSVKHSLWSFGGGIHGQFLFVDKAKKLAVVWFASRKGRMDNPPFENVRNV